MGGGGLYSTVGDYLKFARMILHGGILNGARVLRPETVTAMSHNAMGTLGCNAIKTFAPEVSHDVDFLAGMKWRLSFMITTQQNPTGASPVSLAAAAHAN